MAFKPPNDIKGYDFYIQGYMDGFKDRGELAHIHHGQWLEVGFAPHGMHYATCSVCGERQTLENMHYCPNCGASMMEEADVE